MLEGTKIKFYTVEEYFSTLPQDMKDIGNFSVSKERTQKK